jgi:hypothetical protein
MANCRPDALLRRGEAAQIGQHHGDLGVHVGLGIDDQEALIVLGDGPARTIPVLVGDFLEQLAQLRERGGSSSRSCSASSEPAMDRGWSSANERI